MESLFTELRLYEESNGVMGVFLSQPCPVWSVCIYCDGGLQVLKGADLGTQAQVRRGEHGLRPRARDVGHRGGHV